MQEHADAQVLLTGATGFLGKVVLHDLLRDRERLGIDCVHLLIRPRRRDADERFEQEIAASPCLAGLPPAWRRHVRVVPGDLSEPAGLLAARDALAGRLTHIVHCAASVDFDLPLPDALAANTTSALEVLELARACEGLVSMVSVSTAYVTPHAASGPTVREVLAPLPRPAAELYEAIRAGAVDAEALLRESGHPNTYTLTKCITEHLLAERRGRVPLTLLRPSIISASLERPMPGWIDSPAAFALFIMAVGTGKLRAVVADPNARLDVIPCDAVAERVVHALFTPPGDALRIRHAVAGPTRSLPLEVCRQGIEHWFQHNPVADAREDAVRVHYLGPPGPRYEAMRKRHHLGRRDARLVVPKLDAMNEGFAYFTQKSFHFASSVPFAPPDFEPRAYVERVARGVSVHLLDADLEQVSVGGLDHPRPPRRLTLRQPVPGIAQHRAWQAQKRLAAHFDRVTVDRLSFERNLAATPGDATVLAPANPDVDAEALLVQLAVGLPDLWPGRVAIGELDSQATLRVRIERSGARAHLRCEEAGAGAQAGACVASAPPAAFLVTGASGFLGRHLLETLQRDAPRHARLALVRDAAAWSAAPHTRALDPLRLVNGSVEDSAPWRDTLPPLAGIFHLAAVVHHSRRSSEEIEHINVEGCLSMVRLAARMRCRLVLLSTSGTVGCFADEHARADETSPWCASTIERWPYYASKQRAEEASQQLADELGVELVIIRPPILLGPGDHRFRSTHNVLRALQGRLPFIVRGGMHYTDVRDAADAVLRAMQHAAPQPVYHLPGTMCSVRDFFDTVEALSGVPGPRFELPGGPARWAATLSARLGLELLPDPVVVEMACHHWGMTSLYAHDHLGYRPRSGKETLADTIAWLRDHHDAL